MPQATYDSCIRTDGALSISPAKAVTNNAPLREVIQIVDDRVLTFDPEERDASRAFVERGFLPPGTKRYKDRRFIFDKVFDHQARQEDVFHNTAKPLLTNLLDGYNATIFAYGVRPCIHVHTACYLHVRHRLPVVAKHTLSAAPTPTQVSYISRWQTYSNVLKTDERNSSSTLS